MPDKAQQILKAAEKLFAAGRYHEVTLDEICKTAGVGKGTVYRYFEGKEHLFYQVILCGLDELVESVQRVGREECNPSEGLRHVARKMVEFFSERKALFSLMHSAQLRRSGHKKKVWRKWHRRTDKMMEVIAGLIQKGVDEGRYRDDFPPQAAARMLMGMIRTGQRNRREMPGGKNWPDSVVNLLEHGLS